jgi:hypothetical protein
MTTGHDDHPSSQGDPIDLDVLRGWREDRDPALRQRHQLPMLAELVELGPGEKPTGAISLHGPDLLLGRFQSHYAPVDIGFRHLKDHQLYRMGAPHVHLSHDGQGWSVEVLSPQARTAINGNGISHLHDDHHLRAGDLLTLGVTRFEFRPTDMPLKRWDDARRRLLEQVDEPALFLKRRGGLCGPHMQLGQGEPLILGRTYPAPGTLPRTEKWPAPDARRWDLSGLFDEERKFISFRHARVSLQKGQWTIEPLSNRHRTFVNRIGITGTVALQSGDEIGLGSVLIRFHHPHRSLEYSRPRHVPTVVDWSEGRPPSAPPPEKK